MNRLFLHKTAKYEQGHTVVRDIAGIRTGQGQELGRARKGTGIGTGIWTPDSNSGRDSDRDGNRVKDKVRGSKGTAAWDRTGAAAETGIGEMS